jgi:hypothetical protein
MRNSILGLIALAIFCLASGAASAHDSATHPLSNGFGGIIQDPLQLPTTDQLLLTLIVSGEGHPDRGNYDPGECKTWTTSYDRTASVPAPDNIIIDIWSDGDVLRRTLYNGDEVGLPSSFEICGTDDFTSSGFDVAQTARVRIRMDSADLLFPYDYDTDDPSDDGPGDPPTARGAWIRVGSKAMVVKDDAGLGQQYRYGTATDNFIVARQVTTNTTTGYNHQMTFDWFNPISDVVYETQAFSTTAACNSGPNCDDTLSSKVDDSYPFTSHAVSVRLNLISLTTMFLSDTFGLEATDGEQKVWSFFIQDVGQDVVWLSETSVKWLRNNSVSSGITFDSDCDADGINSPNPPDGILTTSFSVRNRGESLDFSGCVVNTGGQELTRATVSPHFVAGPNDDPAESGNSGSVSGTTYAGNIVVGTDWSATFDFIGEGYSFRAFFLDNSVTSLDDNVAISRRYQADPHTQLENSLNKDDFPFQDATEDLQFISGEDSIRIWCHLQTVESGIDIDTPGSPVLIQIFDSESSLVFSSNEGTGSDGWTGMKNQPAQPPTGFWVVSCESSSSVNGNTWDEEQDIGVISAFTADREVLIWSDFNVVPNTNTTIWIMTLKNSDPIDADLQPVLSVRRIDAGAFAVADFEEFEMKNVVDHTETLNGPLYYLNVTFEDTGLWNVAVKSGVEGVFIRMNEGITVGEGEFAAMSAIVIDGLSESALVELAIYTSFLLFGLFHRYLLTATWAFAMLFRPFVQVSGEYVFNFATGFLMGVLLLCLEYYVHKVRPEQMERRRKLV